MPITEPSISINLQEMVRWVLDYQGKYDWIIDDAQVPDITRAKSIVNAAYRDFVNARDWSFLQRTLTLTLPADGTTYNIDMPQDFAALTGKLTYASPNIRWRISEVSEVLIREYRSRSTNTLGIPYLYALRAKEIDTTAGPQVSQGYEIIFWPVPTQVLTLQCQYRTTATLLRNLADVPLGAAQHSDTLQAAVLAKCEILLDKKFGDMNKAYASLLGASIARDAATVPARIGYNGDFSDQQFYPPPGWGVDSYNGVPISF